MNTLLTIPSTAFPPGTYTFGPYAIAAAQQSKVIITPTAWPASGLVCNVSLSFASGDAGGADLYGAPVIPMGKDGLGISIKVQPQVDTEVTATLIVAQPFTASATWVA